MATRAEQKQASLQRILDAASVRLRCEGLSGAAIGAVMQDAGLTHGAFYSHFDNKDELAAAAFRHALKDNRPRWTAGGQKESWPKRLARLAKRYLTAGHRDDRAHGCAFAAVASEAAGSPVAFRQTFEEEMIKSLRAICGAEGEGTAVENEPAHYQDAMAFLALCVGGITLSRAVADPAVSNAILTACQTVASRLAWPDAL